MSMPMPASESQPSGIDLDTTAGGEHEPSTHSMGDTPGSGANELTRAGLPNADPDGYDEQRSDLQNATVATIPPARGSGPPPAPIPTEASPAKVRSYADEAQQRNPVAPPAAAARHDGEQRAGGAPEQGEYGGDGYWSQGNFAGNGDAGLNEDEREELKRVNEHAAEHNPGLGIQNRQD